MPDDKKRRFAEALKRITAGSGGPEPAAKSTGGAGPLSMSAKMWAGIAPVQLLKWALVMAITLGIGCPR